MRMCWQKSGGCFLYYNIVAVIHQKEFNFYYNDDPKIVKGWFEPQFSERVHIRCSPRSDDDISSTNVRNAILHGDTAYLERALPGSVIADMPFLKVCVASAMNDDYSAN